MKQFYRGANVVIVTTMDGVEHVYQFTKNLIVHGGRKPGVDALEGLRDGTTVVIHYTASGARCGSRGNRRSWRRRIEDHRGSRHRHRSGEEGNHDQICQWKD